MSDDFRDDDEIEEIDVNDDREIIVEGTKETDMSNEVNIYIYSIIGASGLTATNITFTDLTLTWVNNNVSGVTGNRVQQYSGGTWVTIATLSSGATTYDVSGLTPDTQYYFRIQVYNTFQTANSSSILAETFDLTPYTLVHSATGYTSAGLTWDLLPASGVTTGATIRIEYKQFNSGVWIIGGTSTNPDLTSFILTGLTDNMLYDVRIVRVYDGIDYISNPIQFTTEDIVLPITPFCSVAGYVVSAATCGNADGKIVITDTDYLTYYDFTLTDIFGNSYLFNQYSGEATGLTGGYYFLSADIKPIYWGIYGRDACTFSWIMVEDTDNPAYLINVSVRPQQCQPFDIQYGRIFYNVSGLTSGSTYSFYAFTSDLSLYYSETGITSTEDFIIANASAQCYWVLIKDEVTGCILLLDNRCVPSINLFSQGGVKKLYIAKWNDDVDYNYWKDSDEDFFLEFEDTSFFYSTKIKEYLSLTGGTTGITWYELPVAPKAVSLSQKLEKVRQGFIFTDTLTFAVSKGNATKWTQMATLLNPENKWMFVVQDADGFWWTGGYRHGARISAYNYKTGARGGDDGYTLEVKAVSENKILTSIDEDYVINYIQ